MGWGCKASPHYSKVTVIYQFCSRGENAFSIKIASFTLLNFDHALSSVYSMFVPQEIDFIIRNSLKTKLFLKKHFNIRNRSRITDYNLLIDYLNKLINIVLGATSTTRMQSR